MTRRRFAPVTVLTDETAILGVPVAQWNELLTAGFVEALPKDAASNDLLNKQSTVNQTTKPVERLATA